MREIELKPSRRLGLLLGMIAGLAVFAIHRATLPAVFQLALVAILSGVLAWGWWRAGRGERLRLAADGRLQCLSPAGDWQDVEVLGDSMASPSLTVLRYRVADRTVRSRVLLPDSADADALRRIRVSLRWAGRTRSDTGFPGAG